jgi:hypothetical protein
MALPVAIAMNDAHWFAHTGSSMVNGYARKIAATGNLAGISSSGSA